MRSSPDIIQGIGDPSKRVLRNPAFEPRHHAGFGPGHYELWNRIGERTSVRELVQKSALGEAQAIAFLRQLLLLHAVDLGDELPPDDDAADFEIVDPSELGQLTETERKLLAEEVDLEPWEQRRIIGAARVLQRGDSFALLGIHPDATRRELKRAYYQLSKEFHPDRYYGKQLGSYGAILSHIFEMASETVHKLAARSVGSAGPRRRIFERYAFPIKLTMQCSSWSARAQLVTQDISEQGLFVVTTDAATRGDRVEVRIAIKRGNPLLLSGRVAVSRPPDVAWRTGRRPGLGIELDPIGDERYARILEAARRGAELSIEDPAETLKEPPPPAQWPSRLGRGTGTHDARPTVLGIDFGTTNSAISVAVDGKVRLIPWSDGSVSAPSVVAFPSARETLVGEAARKRLPIDPTHTISSVKRLLGVPFGDRNIQGLIGQAAYRSSQGPDGGVSIEMWGEQYAVAQIAGLVLRAARDTAEAHLRRAVDRVVLTVPVGFDAHRIESLRRAARLAQLELIAVIDEPTAAGLANRLDPRFQGLVGVYDFGGGTFDFSVVDTSAGDVRVLGTAGDSWLGGDDFDAAIANAVANQIWRRHGLDLRTRVVEWQRLLFSCERTKRRLSSVEEHAVLSIPAALRTAAGEQDLRIRLDRSTCERLWTPLVERSLETVALGFRRAGIGPGRLSAICLSGGTAYIPLVRRMLRERLQLPVLAGVPPEYAACLGATMHAVQIAQGLSSTATAA